MNQPDEGDRPSSISGGWHTNRDWWKRDIGEKDLLLRMRMIGAGLFSSDRYDYAKLMARYRDWPAREADGRLPRQ